MTREEKAQYISDLAAQLSASSVVYLTDTADLTVEAVNTLRRRCFQSNISMRVVKNALLEKAMDQVEGKDFGALRDVLKGSTSVMISEVANAPAKLIADFRKKSPKPLLKGAYIDEAIFIGDDPKVSYGGRGKMNTQTRTDPPNQTQGWQGKYFRSQKS